MFCDGTTSSQIRRTSVNGRDKKITSNKKRERFTGGSLAAGAMLLAAAMSVFPPPAVAAVPAANCPLAGERFSLDSSLFDIFTHPKAKAAVEGHAPGYLEKLPSHITGTTLPALSAIISLRMVSSRMDAAQVSAVSDALRTVPVTADVDRIRCARYDDGTPPPLEAITRHPALLVFDKSTGFRDVPSIDAASAAIRTMAREQGWQLVFTDRPASFNRRDLARFDAVIWNNVSGDVLTFEQRAAFREFIEQGGGYVGIHGSNGDSLTYWDWYADTLVGARFKGHPADPQFQEARVVVDDPDSPITAGLARSWMMTDEWYSFQTSPRTTGARVLATLDESSYRPFGPAGDLHMGDHPIAWTRCIGKGRSFYTAIGHLPQTYSQPSAARLLGQGIAWAATSGKRECGTTGKN